METKQIEITCPCCDTLLLIDVRTRSILRRRKAADVTEEGKPKVSAEDFDNAFARVRGRAKGRADKLDSLLGEQKRRAQDLDARFDEARKRAEGDASEPD